MASGCNRVDSTPKNQQQKSGASGLAFLSVTSGLVFVSFLFRLGPQRELRCRDLRDTRSPNPLSFFVDPTQERPERAPPIPAKCFSSGSVCLSFCSCQQVPWQCRRQQSTVASRAAASRGARCTKPYGHTAAIGLQRAVWYSRPVWARAGERSDCGE